MPQIMPILSPKEHELPPKFTTHTRKQVTMSESQKSSETDLQSEQLLELSESKYKMVFF